MTVLVHNLPDSVYMLVTGAANAFVLVAVLYLVKCVFELDFMCSCGSYITYHELAFMVYPVIIISAMVSLFKPKSPSCNRAKYIIDICYASAVFWTSAVFLDGDWWLCVSTHNATHNDIPCKDTSNLTNEEMKTFREHKSSSLVIGLNIIIVALLLWCIAPRLTQCCRKKRCPSFYKLFYEESLQKETEKYLKEELTKIAKMTAKKKFFQHLAVIKRDQGLTYAINEDGKGDIEETWKTISSPDFHAEKINACLELLYKYYNMEAADKFIDEETKTMALSDIAANKVKMLQDLENLLKKVRREVERGETDAAEGISTGGESPSQAGICMGGESPSQVGICMGGESPSQAGSSKGGESPSQAGICMGGESPSQAGICMGGESPSQAGSSTGGQSPSQADTESADTTPLLANQDYCAEIQNTEKWTTDV